MPKLKDYKILAPFTADELINNANALLRDIPNAQIQKRTLRFYSSQALLPPPKGPRSKAQYGYEHLVILVALRVFKHLGLKLERIEAIIRSQLAEGIEKLEETVQQYLDRHHEQMYESSFYNVSEGFLCDASEDLMQAALIEDLDSYLPFDEQPPQERGFMGVVSNLLGRRDVSPKPEPKVEVKKKMRVELAPDITLEFPEYMPLRTAVRKAYAKLQKLLDQLG
ncbi:hypothetical protein HRbin16_02720 [bacterium HR16]|nr:hypothetical protein HRbin16_02720 [bacterium HR16]